MLTDLDRKKRHKSLEIINPKDSLPFQARLLSQSSSALYKKKKQEPTFSHRHLTSFSDSLMARIEGECPPLVETVPPVEYMQQFKFDREMNTIEFKISATGTINILTIDNVLLGETIHARIFLWDQSTKIVISDVDGTITKSDIKGHIYTRLGRAVSSI